jgi:MHS family proline/betaine transporter-like MFS transporter
MPGYFTKDLGYSTTTSSVVIIAVEIGQMLVITFLGRLSDRIGRKPLLLTAAIGFIVLSWPCVQLIQLGNVVTLVIGFAIVAFLLVCILAVIGSTFPAMFPTRVRYGAFSIGYNVSTAIFGGTAGFAVQGLIKATGTNNIPAYYLIAAAIIGLVPIILIPETAKVPMEQIEADTKEYTPVA